jgi:hypothetical protein
MESKLSINEFRERIKNNTKIGSANLRLSPLAVFSIFDLTSKPFYGTFDNAAFQLTTNSILSPTFYVAKGEYETINGKLNINYKVEPSSKLQLIWIKYFPIVSLVLMNFLFLFDKKTEIELYIISNLSILFILFYSRWNTKLKMKKLERKFNEIFEVII